MRIVLIALAALLALAPPAMAQTTDAPAATASAADIAALSAALQTAATFDVIARESAAAAVEIDTVLFGGTGGAPWAEASARIHDPAVLLPAYEAELARVLADDPVTVAAALAFYDTDLGQRILSLELEARLALTETETREAAEVRAEKMGEARDPRLRLYRRIAEAGDMIERRTTETLASYLAFNEGLVETGPAEFASTPEELSADVYAQEAQIRADSATWTISFMATAYAPLTDAEVEALADFAETPEGKALVAALFTAYTPTLTRTSRALGQAAGREFAGRDV